MVSLHYNWYRQNKPMLKPCVLLPYNHPVQLIKKPCYHKWLHKPTERKRRHNSCFVGNTVHFSHDRQKKTDITCFLYVYEVTLNFLRQQQGQKHQHLGQTLKQPANPWHHLVKQEELGLGELFTQRSDTSPPVTFLAQKGGPWLPVNTSSMQMILENEAWGELRLKHK